MTDSPDKLSLVVFSADFDRLHYALVMASAAAAVGTQVTLFYTMHGARALMADWRDMQSSDGRSAGAFDEAMKARNVAHYEELIEACVALGVRFMVCEMGLRALDQSRDDLRSDIQIDLGGVVTFLDDASKDGAMMFI